MSQALAEAGLAPIAERSIAPDVADAIKTLLHREHRLHIALEDFLHSHETPEIDAIAVTHGPGLEPALWAGVNFAKALSVAWHIPLIPANHLEGHIVSAMMHKESDDTYAMRPIEFPVLSLLISGGHTELVLLTEWINYEVIGTTRDDAVGEAFDKVARMLGLPYPGGIHLSNLAEQGRRAAHMHYHHPFTFTCVLPRPMISTPDSDFSFSGLKTAVLYVLKQVPELTNEARIRIALEFEDAVADVLVAKTTRAIRTTNAHTLIVGGGVSANKHIKRRLEAMIAEEFPDTYCYTPSLELATDNAVMIGMAAYARHISVPSEEIDPMTIRADGNLRLADTEPVRTHSRRSS
jgi:N6-L-threonylcarbamoyladenine synthase